MYNELRNMLLRTAPLMIGGIEISCHLQSFAAARILKLQYLLPNHLSPLINREVTVVVKVDWLGDGLIIRVVVLFEVRMFHGLGSIRP